MTRFIQLTENTKAGEKELLINSNAIHTIRKGEAFTYIEYADRSTHIIETPGEIMALCSCKKKELPFMQGRIMERRKRETFDSINEKKEKAAGQKIHY